MIAALQILHLIYIWFLEFIPNPEYFIFPYLSSSGWLPYLEIIDQHFPGLWLLPVNFFSLGFTDWPSLKVLLLLIVLTQSVQIRWLASRLFPKSSVPVFAVSVYLLLQPFFAGSDLWLDLFLPLFTLPAFYFYTKRNWRLSGIFFGMGLIFKQSLAPLLLVYLFEIFRSKYKFKNLIDLLFGITLPWIPVVLYLHFNSLVSHFLNWTFIYNLTVYAPLAKLLPRVNDLIKITPPLGLVLVAWWGTHRRFPVSNSLLIWGLLSVLVGLSRFHLKHFQPLLPFASLLIALWLSKLWQVSKSKSLSVLLLVALWTGFFTLSHSGFLSVRFFDPDTVRLVNEISERVDPGTEIYLLGVQPSIYALTHTFPPGRLFVYQLPWYRSFEMDQLGRIVLLQPKLVVVDSSSSIDGHPLSEFAGSLLKYVQMYYTPTGNFGRYVIYSSVDI